MAKITVFGDVIAITSSKTPEEIAELKKYRPKALEIRDAEDKDRVEFSVSTGKNGGVYDFGICFDSKTRDEAGLAMVMLPIAKDVADLNAYIYDKYAKTLINLEKIEAQFAAAMEEIAVEKATIQSCIQIINPAHTEAAEA